MTQFKGLYNYDSSNAFSYIHKKNYGSNYRRSHQDFTIDNLKHEGQFGIGSK